MPVTGPSPGSRRRLRLFTLICLLTVLLVTAAEAPASEYLAYVGTYTGKGSEGIYAFRFDPATGVAQPLGLVAATDNPSFLAADPKGRFLYAVNELASTVTVFAYESGPGTLRRTQTIPTVPAGFAGANTAAEIAVDARGSFLYVSNRGDDSIAVFSIHPDDGSLTSLEWVSSGGKTPRNFAIDPTGEWLLAANQDSDAISLLRIDPRSGRLTPTGRSFDVVSPVCVHIVSLD